MSSTTQEPCDCRKAPRAVANIRLYRLQKSFFPLGRLKTGQDKIVAHQQRTLDEHTVRRQQGELLVLGHGRQLVLQAQIFVDQAARVEEPLEGQAAAGDPFAQLVGGRVVLFNVAGGVLNAVVVKPLFGLLAGGARRVLQKQQGVTSLCFSYSL